MYALEPVCLKWWNLDEALVCGAGFFGFKFTDRVSGDAVVERRDRTLEHYTIVEV